MSVRQTLVCRSKAHLFTKESWRRFAFGAVIFLALGPFSQTASAQTPTASDWATTESRLISQLSGNSEQKRSALFEIRNLHTERASRLAVPALRDSTEIVRATAASSVVFLPITDAVNVLAPLLDDKAEFVRREAAYALGNVGSHETAQVLLRLLQKEKIFEVLTATVIALGKSGAISAIEPLVRLLAAKPKEDEEFLRRSAARSIGQIAQIIRTGKVRVLTPQNFLPDKYKDTHSNANAPAPPDAFASSLVALTQVLQNTRESDDTRREAAFSLGAIGDRSSVSVLSRNVKSSDPYLAEICKEALLKIEESK